MIIEIIGDSGRRLIRGTLEENGIRNYDSRRCQIAPCDLPEHLQAGGPLSAGAYEYCEYADEADYIARCGAVDEARARADLAEYLR